ncbi:Uncharacterised protein [Vibrio cholerae]|uniref:Uncharacterized protein n=1 Tax=Vibrio cholerae TaxID=666 RepID=A0A655X2A7_VIBCL|nr:Uncharacterised protein [Vibrio cholerae]CRZ96432.1 Uncharacterised protein [Vibrio cholerae]CSA00959.1 Uncharacterised protein [Vibrio cholerae]CSB27900.1 Uncharacterised protein [Vibrio cholerae]CSB37936.1 Uncharacterised protein [Vibrio cholerae]
MFVQGLLIARNTLIGILNLMRGADASNVSMSLTDEKIGC